MSCRGSYPHTHHHITLLPLFFFCFFFFFCGRHPHFSTHTKKHTPYDCHTVTGKARPLHNAGVKSQRSVLSFHIKPRSRGQSLIPLPPFSLPPSHSLLLPPFPPLATTHPTHSSAPHPTPGWMYKCLCCQLCPGPL